MKTKKMLEVESKYRNTEISCYIDFWEYADGRIEVTLDGRLDKQGIKELLAAFEEATDAQVE